MSTMAVVSEAHWYAVRSVIRWSPTEPDGNRPYEERVTLWRAGTFDEAIDRAEAESTQYAAEFGADYLIDFGQAYRLYDEPGDGSEVFSLLRDSDLEPDDYVATHFDTGTEHQH
jgi:hypothetical protein